MPISGVALWVSTLILPFTHRMTFQDLNTVNYFENFSSHLNLRFDNTQRFLSHFNDDRAQSFHIIDQLKNERKK